MKKFINSVENVEKEMIEGMLKAYPVKIAELNCGSVLVRTKKKTDKVAIISGDVAVMVNGSGGTPLMELYIVNRRIHAALAECGISVYKTLVGNFMTSIDQEGFSISLLKLDDQMKMLLDAPADTPAYKA